MYVTKLYWPIRMDKYFCINLKLIVYMDGIQTILKAMCR